MLGGNGWDAINIVPLLKQNKVVWWPLIVIFWLIALMLLVIIIPIDYVYCKLKKIKDK